MISKVIIKFIFIHIHLDHYSAIFSSDICNKKNLVLNALEKYFHSIFNFLGLTKYEKINFSLLYNFIVFFLLQLFLP